jgi:iron complex transport system ATP-binding protein
VSAPFLEASDVTVRLGGRAVVEAATLSLRAGDFTVLVGPNGAGKTTLVRALAGLLPFEGTIALDGRPLDAWSPRERAHRIGYLPQGAAFSWPMTAESIVALGRYPHGDPFSSATEEDRSAVRDAMDATGTAALARRIVTQLSGGERARVALARALATRAGILLADEPTVSLDARHQLVVMELLRNAAHAGTAVFAVIHDLALAARFADRVAVIEAGRIVAQGTPETTLDAARIGAVFGVEADIVTMDGRAVPIPRRPI